METIHKTKRIAIKTAPVDIGIIPLVKWVNSLYMTFTLFSCEGNADNKPYFSFICGNNQSLYRIVKLVTSFNGEVQVDSGDANGWMLRYTAYFDDKYSLDSAINSLKSTKQRKELGYEAEEGEKL